MKTNLGIKDSLREDIKDSFKHKVKNFLIRSLIWLKNTNPLTRGLMIITGQVRDELYDPSTGEIVTQNYPIQLAGNFNTIQNAFKYAIAKWTGASNASGWIGSNGLMTQASFTGNDGILETGTGYSYTTTKDSGGTGAEDNIVFKGVRTAAGSETHATLKLGLSAIASPVEFTTDYASQTISKSLTSGQVYTVYWTVTVS